jgi:hypothetical protein
LHALFHRPSMIFVAASQVNFRPAPYRAQSPRGPPA